MSAKQNWQDKIKARNEQLHNSPTAKAVFPMGIPGQPVERSNEDASKKIIREITDQVLDSEKQNSRNAEVQNSADAQEQTSREAEQQTSVLAEVQKTANAEVQKAKDFRRMTIHVPNDQFKQLKQISLDEDMTMLEIGEEMVNMYIAHKLGK